MSTSPESVVIGMATKQEDACKIAATNALEHLKIMTAWDAIKTNLFLRYYSCAWLWKRSHMHQLKMVSANFKWSWCCHEL